MRPGGPAERAGLEVGDVVLSLNGKIMENGRQFTVNLYQQPIGQKVKLEVLRAGERQKFKVEVVKRPDDPLRFADMVSPEQNFIPKLGILCLEIDQRIARMLPGLRHKGGVIVAARAPGALQFEEGFEPGDVIYAVNGASIRTLAGLREKIGAFIVGDPVVVQVERGGELIYIAFRL